MITRVLWCLAVMLMTAGCVSGGPVSELIEDVEQATVDPNTYKVVCAHAETDTPFLNAEADVKKTQFPVEFDTSTLTGDQFVELTKCPER